MAKNPRGGGPQPPDYRVRVGGPGRMSQRNDMQGNQPIRVASGQPYGSRDQMEGAQQAVRLPQAGGPMGGPSGQGPRMSSDGTPVDPLALFGADSQRPDEPITQGLDELGPEAEPVHRRQMMEALELLMQSLPQPSAPLMNLYLELRGEDLD
jgi:hypothetical protein